MARGISGPTPGGPGRKGLRGLPRRASHRPLVGGYRGRSRRLVPLQSEPGLEVDGPRRGRQRNPSTPLAILIDLDGAEKAASSALASEIRRNGWGLVTLDLRATGKLAWPSDKIGRAPDHNTAEWGLLIGRPLLGQWVHDVRRLLDALGQANGASPTEVVLIGDGPGGLVALCAAAVDRRVARVAAVGTLLVTTWSEGPVRRPEASGSWRAGDRARCRGRRPPRPWLVRDPTASGVLAGGVAGATGQLPADQLRRSYRASVPNRGLLKARHEFSVLGKPTDAAGVVEALR